MFDVPAESITELMSAVPSATTNSRGVLRTATAAETAIGTDAARIVTPSSLAASRYYAQADRNGVTRTLDTNAWTQIGAANEISDVYKVYDANTGFYTAPITGLYMSIAILRLADAASADQVGFTVDTAGRDGAYTVWGDRASTGNRFTLQQVRVLSLTAGQSVAMWGYSPSAARTASNASLTVFRI